MVKGIKEKEMNGKEKEKKERIDAGGKEEGKG